MSEISVLVPSYNHAPFIERTLRSIFAQTHPVKKLIVIDDGSNDESPQITERILLECPFDSEFVQRENRGLCATLNEGFSRSTGEYFAYLGSDDIWLPSFLAEQIGLLESRPAALLAFAHAYLIDENDNIIDRTDHWTDFADRDLLPLLLRGEIFSSPGVVYRSSALKKHGWNERVLLEDYELYLKLCAEGEFARNEKLLCAWRQHGWNTSGNFPAMLKEQLAAQNRLAENLGIHRSELDRIQQELRFKAVSGYIRNGYKSEAWPLFWKNLKGSESLVQTLKTFARLSLPQWLFQWNRRRKHGKAAKKNGQLRLS